MLCRKCRLTLERIRIWFFSLVCKINNGKWLVYIMSCDAGLTIVTILGKKYGDLTYNLEDLRVK